MYAQKFAVVRVVALTSWYGLYGRGPSDDQVIKTALWVLLNKLVVECRALVDYRLNGHVLG